MIKVLVSGQSVDVIVAYIDDKDGYGVRVVVCVFEVVMVVAIVAVFCFGCGGGCGLGYESGWVWGCGSS